MKCPNCRHNKLLILIPMYYKLTKNGSVGVSLWTPMPKPHNEICCANCDWIGRYSDLTQQMGDKK